MCHASRDAATAQTVAPAAAPAPAPSPAAGLFSPGQRIGQRYTIIKILGRGGMGMVYQAWDDVLGVNVAIKTILPGASAEPAEMAQREQRFKRELLLARQVSHKNVVRIHDIGEVDDAKYITMAFVEGETLATRLQRLGHLPVREALALARQIADGLAAAHEVGIVHRDLKPENVMVTPDGVAVIMDFGIARLAEPTTGTTVGVIVGTIEYMAPEQAMGQAVDARTDVYALGLLVYDLLTGRQRLTSHTSAMSELLARTNHAPAAPRTLGAIVPDATEAIVMRCVQPDPAARFTTAAEVSAALARLAPDGTGATPVSPVPVPPPRPRWVGAVALGAVLAAVVAFAWFRQVPDAPVETTSRPPVTVLVADFVNAVGDPTFDGLVEQALGVGIESSSFITAFPRRDALRAAALLPATSLDESTARLVAIREGVQVVVTGRIDAQAGTYHLSARAITPGTNERTLVEWSTDAHGKDEVLPAVGRVAARLRSALGDATANPEHVRAEDMFTAASIDAARAFVEGQEMLARGRPDEALAAYRRALAVDPDLGRAWSGIGAVLNNLGRRDEAIEAYGQALSRIERMTERERFRTRSAYYIVTRNAQKAIEESEALVQRFPSDGAGLANLANAYFQQRNFAKADEVGRAAAAIYPGNVLRQNNVALFALYAGRFEEAEAQARKVLALNSEFVKAHLGVALAQVATSRLAEARATYQALAALTGGRGFAVHGLADLALYTGRLTEAAAAVAPELALTSGGGRARLALVLAEARLLAGDTSAAAAAIATIALAQADPFVRFEAGRLLTAAGRAAEARTLARTLSDDIEPEVQALGGVLEAELALAAGDARTALARLAAARVLADSWWLRFVQGRAYLAAGRFAEADSEFDLCLRRRGEAVAVFLDDVPTWRRLAPVYYYQGLARAGLGSSGAAESFRTFLAIKDGGDETLGLVADARARLAALR